MAIVANRYWILLALVTAAVVSYGLGFMIGLGLFVAAGVIFEFAFWLQLLKRGHRFPPKARKGAKATQVPHNE